MRITYPTTLTFARHCDVCLHIGKLVLKFGDGEWVQWHCGENMTGCKLEICTWKHWWKWSKPRLSPPASPRTQWFDLTD